MATVNVSFTLKKQSFPATQSPSNQTVVKLMRAGAVLAQNTIISPGLATNFTPVADGTYTVSAQRIGMDGVLMGSPAVSSEFTVVNMADVDVPDIVTVTL